MLFKYVWFKLVSLAYELLPPTVTCLMHLSLPYPISSRFGNKVVMTFLGVGLCCVFLPLG